MKIITFSIILLSALNLNFANINPGTITPLSLKAEMQTSVVVFLKPFPEKLKLLEKVDFSFYVNQSVVSQYRYKIEVPKALVGLVKDELTNWSVWKSDYSINIPAKSFDKEGKFKFLVEYKLLTTNETQLFEKIFEVKWENPEVRESAFTVNSEYINSGSTDSEKLKRASEEYKKMSDLWTEKFKTEYKNLELKGQSPDLLISKLSESITATSGTVIINLIGKDISAKNVLQAQAIQKLIQKGNSDLIPIYRNPSANTAASMASVSKAVYEVYQEEYKKSINPATLGATAVIITATNVQVVKPPVDKPANQTVSTEKPKESIDVPEVKKNNETTPKTETEIIKNDPVIDYNKMLLESIEKKNASLFIQSIKNGANTNITGDYGGNIFHVINGKISDENIIPVLIKRGNSINLKDNFGNTPLHFAILTGKTEYARELIRQGADLTIKNQQELTPLNLSSFLNDEETVKELLKKGADVNSSGNSGYAPLHIAVEMNHPAIAKDLLTAGAVKNLKTSQNLNPKTISVIQNNKEMKKLVKSNGSYSYGTVKTAMSQNYGQADVKSYPQIDFNLAYDQELVKKRQMHTIIQWFSLPVFIGCAAGAAYFRSEANNYFSMYENAETEEVARDNYDKAGQYDTYSIISGSISACAVITFTNSTIRKNKITIRMRKPY